MQYKQNNKFIEFDENKEIGRKFGGFTVLSLLPYKDRIKVLCQCNCGKEKIKIWSELLRGYQTQNCGRCIKINPEDYIDKIINRLKLIKIFIQKDSSNVKRTMGKFLCHCGVECDKQFYQVFRGKISSCGCLLKQKYVNQKLPNEIVTKNLIIRNYKQGALKRNLCFELSDEQIIKICSDNCYYCGEKPSNNFNWKSHKRLAGSYIYNGIDRLNNDTGYTIENTVACCQLCNFGKRNLSKENFLNWINKVYKHQNNC